MLPTASCRRSAAVPRRPRRPMHRGRRRPASRRPSRPRDRPGGRRRAAGTPSPPTAPHPCRTRTPRAAAAPEAAGAKTARPARRSPPAAPMPREPADEQHARDEEAAGRGERRAPPGDAGERREDARHDEPTDLHADCFNPVSAPRGPGSAAMIRLLAGFPAAAAAPAHTTAGRVSRTRRRWTPAAAPRRRREHGPERDPRCDPVDPAPERGRGQRRHDVVHGRDDAQLACREAEVARHRGASAPSTNGIAALAPMAPMSSAATRAGTEERPPDGPGTEGSCPAGCRNVPRP